METVDGLSENSETGVENRFLEPGLTFDSWCMDPSEELVSLPAPYGKMDNVTCILASWHPEP